MMYPGNFPWNFLGGVTLSSAVLQCFVCWNQTTRSVYILYFHVIHILNILTFVIHTISLNIFHICAWMRNCWGVHHVCYCSWGPLVQSILAKQGGCPWNYMFHNASLPRWPNTDALTARSPEEKFLSSLPTTTLKNLDKSKCVSLYKLVIVCHSIICW